MEERVVGGLTITVFFYSVLAGFKNFANFTGRATRTEYWCYTIFLAVVVYSLRVCASFIFYEIDFLQNFENTYILFIHFVGIPYYIFAIPSLSLICRRLRDSGLNVRWIWVWYIGFIAITHLLRWALWDNLSFINLNNYILILNPILTVVDSIVQYIFALDHSGIEGVLEYSAFAIPAYILYGWIVVWMSRKGICNDIEVQPDKINAQFMAISSYLGAGIAGFLLGGFIGFFTIGSAIPGLTGLLALIGGAAAVILTIRYRKSRRVENRPSESPHTQIPTPQATPENVEPDLLQSNISPTCTNCGDTSPNEATHCISCGNKLPPLICPKCQTENISRAKFCMGCGEER